MFDRLTAVLSSAGVDVSTDELLDVLWLAVARGAGEPEDGPPPERQVGPRPGPGPLDEAEDALDLDVDHGGPGPLRESPSVEPPQGLYAPAGPGDRGRPSRSVGVHGVRALRSPRALGRAMRPLRRTVDSRTELVLDEQATVDRMAETGLPEPVLRPLPERWLSAALVIDDGPSMVLWRQLADEVKTLLQAQGIFRDIRTYTMDSGDGTGPLVRSGGTPVHAAAPTDCAWTPPAAPLFSYCPTWWGSAGAPEPSMPRCAPGRAAPPSPYSSRCRSGCGRSRRPGRSNGSW